MTRGDNTECLNYLKPMELFEEGKLVKICAPMVRYSKYVNQHMPVIIYKILFTIGIVYTGTSLIPVCKCLYNSIHWQCGTILCPDSRSTVLRLKHRHLKYFRKQKKNVNKHILAFELQSRSLSLSLTLYLWIFGQWSFNLMVS